MTSVLIHRLAWACLKGSEQLSREHVVCLYLEQRCRVGKISYPLGWLYSWESQDLLAFACTSTRSLVRAGKGQHDRNTIRDGHTNIKQGRILCKAGTFGIFQTTLCTSIVFSNILYVLRLSATGNNDNLFTGL